MFDKWFSVEEKPPFCVGDAEYTGYLVYSDGYIQIADYVKEDDGIALFHINGEYDPNVTHWMILPREPEGDDEQ